MRELVEDSLKLERFLRAQAPLSAKVSVKLTHSLIDIVAYARAHGVLVGRRRPSGIYVQRDGALKVADFDLSNELFASIVETGVFDDFRAQHFAPSEPHGFGENHDKLDHLERESEDCFDVFPEASDLLWLGRMFFQMLSGQDYHFESAHRLIVEGYGRANEEGVLCREGALKGCPRDVLVVLARMMSSEAGKRFKTLAEARAVLEAMLKSPFWAAEG